LNQRRAGKGSFSSGPFDSIDDFTLWERCVTRGLPGAMLPHILGNSYQIIQSPGLVAIRYELIHDVRIHPDRDCFQASACQQPAWLRDGRRARTLDGDTLVVETTNFKDRSTFRNANAATLRLVERSCGRLRIESSGR